MTDSETKKMLGEFTRRAAQRLKDKQVPKYRTLHVASLDIDVKIRNLKYNEIVEALSQNDPDDSFCSDKYSIYHAMVDPNLKEVAKELKEAGEIHEYMEIVNIFDVGEIMELSKQISDLSGVTGAGSVTVVDALKN